MITLPIMAHPAFHQERAAQVIAAAQAEVTNDRVIDMDDLVDMGIPIRDVLPAKSGSDLAHLVGDLQPRPFVVRDWFPEDTCGW